MQKNTRGQSLQLDGYDTWAQVHGNACDGCAFEPEKLGDSDACNGRACTTTERLDGVPVIFLPATDAGRLKGVTLVLDGVLTGRLT